MENLSTKDIGLIAESVAKIFERQKQTTQKEARDFRLRNTKLLLNKYRYLKLNINTDTPDIELTPDEAESLKNDDFKLFSIIKERGKTKRMMWFLDACLAGYKEMCANGGKNKYDAESAWRRYMIIEYLYTGKTKLKADELCDRYAISKRTLYRDRDRAIRELSVLIFGIEAVEDITFE